MKSSNVSILVAMSAILYMIRGMDEMARGGVDWRQLEKPPSRCREGGFRFRVCYPNACALGDYDAGLVGVDPVAHAYLYPPYAVVVHVYRLPLSGYGVVGVDAGYRVVRQAGEVVVVVF